MNSLCLFKCHYKKRVGWGDGMGVKYQPLCCLKGQKRPGNEEKSSGVHRHAGNPDIQRVRDE